MIRIKAVIEREYLFEDILVTGGNVICLKVVVLRFQDDGLFKAIIERLDLYEIKLMEHDDVSHVEVWVKDNFSTALIQKISAVSEDQLLTMVVKTLRDQFHPNNLA